jgi:hypothetical protein
LITPERLAFMTVFTISRVIASNRLDRTASRNGSIFEDRLLVSESGALDCMLPTRWAESQL